MSIVLKKKTTSGNCFTDPIAVEEYNKSHNGSSPFGKSGSGKRFIDINHNLESISKAAGLTLEAIKNKVLWKKRSVNLTDYDPVYKVIYLGNVLTPWAKGQESVEKPLATLWKNYCLNVKHEIVMKLTICNSGLKAITREHGLTEYWSNRITFCTTHPKYPRVFCWVYRHEGKKLKHELRCHAVLCNKDIEASDARTQLTSRLSIALAEFKREKRMKQNTRLLLSKAYQCHQLICSEHNNHVHDNHHHSDDVDGDICQRRGHNNDSICRTALLTSTTNTSSGASSLNNSTSSTCTTTSSLLHHHNNHHHHHHHQHSHHHHHNNVLRNLTMDDSDTHFSNPSSDSIDSAHGQSDILCLTTGNLCDESTNTEVANSLISARSSTSSTSSRSSSTSSCSCSAGSTTASLCRCKRSSKKNQSTCTLNSTGANCTGSLFNIYNGKSGNLLIPVRKKHLVKGQANFKPPLERSKSAPRLTSIDEEEDDEVSSLESDESNSNDSADEDETVDDVEQVIEEDVGVSLEDETDYVTSINECSLDDEEEEDEDDQVNDESEHEKDAVNIEQFCRPQVDNHKIIETLPSGRPRKTTYQYVLDTI